MKKNFILLGMVLVVSLSACNGNKNGHLAVMGNPDSSSAGNDPTDQGKVMSLNAEQFKNLIWDFGKHADTWIFQGDLPVIVDFYADWCRPCKIVAPIMDELAQEYKGKIRIYKVNTDKEKELARVFNIRTIPAVLLIPKNGKPQMSVGALPKPTFIQAIQEVLLVK